jgi:hypothetical protein
MSTATVDAGRHVASAAARRPNLAVAALPLGAHAQQSAGLEPRQLIGYGRSDWSSKLTQDWDPCSIRWLPWRYHPRRKATPFSHGTGFMSLSCHCRLTRTFRPVAFLRDRVVVPCLPFRSACGLPVATLGAMS